MRSYLAHSQHIVRGSEVGRGFDLRGISISPLAEPVGDRQSAGRFVIKQPCCPYNRDVNLLRKVARRTGRLFVDGLIRHDTSAFVRGLSATTRLSGAGNFGAIAGIPITRIGYQWRTLVAVLCKLGKWRGISGTGRESPDGCRVSAANSSHPGR